MIHTSFLALASSSQKRPGLPQTQRRPHALGLPRQEGQTYLVFGATAIS